MPVAAVPSSRVNRVACRMVGPGSIAWPPVAMVTQRQHRQQPWLSGREGRGLRRGEAGSVLHSPSMAHPTVRACGMGVTACEHWFCTGCCQSSSPEGGSHGKGGSFILGVSLRLPVF